MGYVVGHACTIRSASHDSEVDMSSGGWSDLAHQILAVTATCLDAGTIGAPKDMFVGHALPAADCCDQLVVWLTAATPAQATFLPPP